MRDVLLGPMLRYVDETSATVWVETNGACTVEVLGRSTPTFHVEGHWYALVVIEHLVPGTVTPYEVRLDGRVCWPTPDSAMPASVIRTLPRDTTNVRLLLGSCRTAAPHEPPYTLELAHDPRGRGVDAIWAYALRMARQPIETWPHAIVLTGDQVYADDSSPETRERVKATRTERGRDEPPLDQVANFEQFTWLYHEAWSPEIERWFFSVMPASMIFDDHDMIDDWNLSASWLEHIREKPWWNQRLDGGLLSYWIYQHLGNLSPSLIRDEGVLARLYAEEDGGDLLRNWVRDPATRFSSVRRFGNTTLVVVDCRTSRVLEPKRRKLVDDDEMAWVAEQCRDVVDHLLIVTSLPVFVTGGLYDLQVWSEAVCDGAWGPPGAWVGERMRRWLDLEDWPAFRLSFDDMVQLLHGLGSGPDAPATISVLSGDIHFSFVASVSLGVEPAPTSAIHQIVVSPIRNALVPRERRVLRFALSRAGWAIARGLRRLARRRSSVATWALTEGPVFDNSLGVITIDSRTARFTVERATSTRDGEHELQAVIDVEL